MLHSGSNKKGRNPAHFPFNTKKAAVFCHKLCHKVISCKSCLERNLFLRLPLPAAHTKLWRLSAVSVQSTTQTVLTALSPYHGETINMVFGCVTACSLINRLHRFVPRHYTFQRFTSIYLQKAEVTYSDVTVNSCVDMKPGFLL